MEALKEHIENIENINDITSLIEILKRKKKQFKGQLKNDDKMKTTKQFNDHSNNDHFDNDHSDNDHFDNDHSDNDHPDNDHPDNDPINKPEEKTIDTRIKQIVFLRRDMNNILLACIQGDEKHCGIISVAIDDYRKLVREISNADIGDSIKFNKYTNYGKIAKRGKNGKWTIN